MQSPSFPLGRTAQDGVEHVGAGEEYVMDSFDVASLYTNVSREGALQAVSEILTERQTWVNLYGLSVSQIMTLVNECLMCNVFKWSGEYYRQIRKLAMGQRLAPVLAVAFMSKVENPILERVPTLHCRYIDDCFILCSTQPELDTCFELLNQQPEHIKLTRKSPTENWLAFLNVELHLAYGTIKTRWYRRPSIKNILIHYRSAHPSSTKAGIIRNMFRTASSVSSDSEQKALSMKMALNIAKINGYPVQSWQRRRRRQANAPRREEERNKVPFCVPFISDEMSTEIRKCVRAADLQDMVRIIDVPPTNLKAQLVRNRVYDRTCSTPSCVVCPNGKEGDCMTTGVVYNMSCNECGEVYIGETGRPLCIRVKEHLDGLRKGNVRTPWGEHRVRCHAGAMLQVSVSILARESDISARKTLEALWITARNPQVNRKEECLAVTQELAPFVELCGF
ncbi:unnamed protein product [Heligmosomoides polygyrus]|uniref:Reverse transcriptase domain-containing protein n=1 Tax=Heligmosomoides polygyrus TaxID=6339 RepID=A0A183GNY2_HELPZ|nr:unnamed protein product [Heligmosomoides polygyrus]